MNFKIDKRKLISGVAVLVLFIMFIIMYFAIGLRYTRTIADKTSNTYTLIGFSGANSLELFKDYQTVATGKDIYGSALTVIIFSGFLMVTVVGSWIIPTPKIMLRVGMYIANYILLLLIFSLSIVVLVEFYQFPSKFNESIFNITATVTPLSFAFLVITGMVLPLLTMGALFDKALFKAMYKMNSVA